ncbi:DNA-directed RNA polymerase III subunit RPC7 isoform X1 [Scleropages formosus]|uniref:DNA-directed RNA polymerase III subunit RPC7 isoform X1 n=1 Tax=Scleropages formosus TaxID=113540 RepID=UPI0008780358|nr:DNA-directed RNA polymerase III subunit RPC7 isoform X1 [Scleropages formosus]
MAAKGRGRGIAAFTFNIEALGISRASLPEATLGPKPLFPDVEYKPVPLSSGEDEEYMLGLKQEMRCTMKRLPFNVTKPEEKAGVERYREMYAQANGKGKRNEWTPDWNRLPKELMPQKRKIKKKPKVKKEPKISSSKEKEELLDKLNDLEKKDEKSDEEKGEKAEENEDEDKEEAEAEEYDEEEVEEENDYIASYFEDGDDYGAGSDDNMDEATY